MNSPGEATMSGLALEKPAVSPVGAIVAATIGNALEFYDFQTYSFFAIQIGRAFFPSKSAYGSLMLSPATFAVGFVTRPIGGIVIGNFSDRAGRRAGMVLSFTLVGGAVVAMALIPPYSMIGIAAPVLVVLTRMVMGFSLGGLPFGGALSDRIGRRPVMICSSLAGIFTVYPVFAWIAESRSPLALLTGIGLLALPFGMMAGAFFAAFTESLPKAIRGGAFGTAYAVSIAAFGGTCPLVMTWLIHITGNPMAVAWYPPAACVAGQVGVRMIPGSAPVCRRSNPHNPARG